MRWIAWLTVAELLRRKTTLAFLVIAGIAIAGSAWFLHFLTPLGTPGVETRLIVSQQLLFTMLAFTGILALSAVFLSAPAVSNEIESGVALTLIARPLSRAEYLLGKWLGLAATVACFATLTVGAELLVTFRSVGYLPPHPVLALLALVAEALVLMTLSLFLSTRLAAMTTGIICTAGFFLAWVTGVAATIGGALGHPALVTVGAVSRLLLPTDGLWQAAAYNLEPRTVSMLTSFDPQLASNPFVILAPPPTIFLMWVGLWVLIVLGLAVWSLRRKTI